MTEGEEGITGWTTSATAAVETASLCGDGSAVVLLVLGVAAADALEPVEDRVRDGFDEDEFTLVSDCAWEALVSEPVAGALGNEFVVEFSESDSAGALKRGSSESCSPETRVSAPVAAVRTAGISDGEIEEDPAEEEVAEEIANVFGFAALPAVATVAWPVLGFWLILAAIDDRACGNAAESAEVKTPSGAVSV
jgi:hypothetical protein